MKGIKYLLSGTCLVAVVLLSGCIVISDGPIPGPVVVEEIEIGCAPPPPPPVIVTRPPRPSRFHIWIEGHHAVRSGMWVWIHGHWERPPRRSAVWVRGHARRRGDIWVWAPGHWN
jgi:hypothetical protein